VFGVEAGKFLGFLQTEREIEAIIAMRSPISVKEMQQLTGRIHFVQIRVSGRGQGAFLFPVPEEK